MNKNRISRRDFLKRLSQTMVAGILANILKLVPEAQGVLAGSKSSTGARDGIVLPDGIKAEPLSKPALEEALTKATGNLDGQALIRFFEKEGYAAQHNQALGYFLSTDIVQVTAVAIPFSQSGDAWLIAADFGSYMTIAGGVAHWKDNTRVIDLYDASGGMLINHHVVEQSPDGTISSKATGKVITQGSGQCELCGFVCGLIKGTSCSLQGAALCLFISAFCGPTMPECFVLCMLIWLQVCWNLGKPCYDVCRDFGYCP